MTRSRRGRTPTGSSHSQKLRQSISGDDLDSEERGERLEIIEKWVYNLVNADVITLVPKAHVAVHEASSAAIDSITQLTVVHRN